jgi:hypothetical protein
MPSPDSRQLRPTIRADGTLARRALVLNAIGTGRRPRSLRAAALLNDAGVPKRTGGPEGVRRALAARARAVLAGW